MTATSAERTRRSGNASPGAADVLHVITGTSRRGAETFALDLAAALAERGRSGRTVALTADGPTPELDVPVLGRRPLGLGTLLALRREARAVRVVVAHGSSAVAACALATLGTRTPYVYRNIGDPTFWLNTPRRRRQMRWLLRRAAATVALWKESESALRALGGGRIRVRIIPTGAPARLFPPVDAKARRDARAALDCSPRGILAVYVGSLSSEKNVGAAVHAVASIPDAELLVVGDGPERARLEALALEIAPGRIRFLGSRERPQDALAAGDVLVLPSRTEGIPAVLIEAGFSEMPVVASAVGGIPDMLGGGESGVLVPPGDAGALASAIVEAVAAGKTLGRAGRRRSLELYEIGVVAEAWDGLLAGLGAWGKAR